MDHGTHTPAHDSCAVDTRNAHSKHGNTSLRVAAHATLHCATGCVIGMFIGFVIGVTVGMSAYNIMGMSTVLAFIIGLAIMVFPLMRRNHLTFKSAIRIVWPGAIMSIGVMQLVMNITYSHMGGMKMNGMSSDSLGNPRFWVALAVAVTSGYIAALPLNAWLIRRQLK